MQHPEIDDDDERIAHIFHDLIKLEPDPDRSLDAADAINQLDPHEARCTLLMALGVIHQLQGDHPVRFRLDGVSIAGVHGPLLNPDLVDRTEDELVDTLEHQYDQREALTPELVWELLNRAALREELFQVLMAKAEHHRALRASPLVMCRPQWLVIDPITDHPTGFQPNAPTAWLAQNEPSLRVFLGLEKADQLADVSRALTVNFADYLFPVQDSNDFDSLAYWLGTNDPQVIEFGTGGITTKPPTITLYWMAEVHLG